METLVDRRRFTAEEFHRMEEAGILRPDDRVELIDGEVVLMSAVGRRHSACVDRLTWHFSALRDRVLMRVQGPTRLSDWSEPLPDILLLEKAEDFYVSGHPTPRDVVLAVEVSRSSLRFDLQVKMPLYARSGIRESWLVDLDAEKVEVYREPGPDGYASRIALGRGDHLSPQALPDLAIPVAEVIP